MASIGKFIKDHGLLAVGLGFAAGIFVATIGMYYYLTISIPDMRDSLKSMSEELRLSATAIKEAREQNRGELGKHIAEENAARDKLDNSLRAIRAHVVVLVQKAEGRKLKPSELKDLLTEIKGVSKYESAFLVGHEVQAGPRLPYMASNVVNAIEKLSWSTDLAGAFKYRQFQSLAHKPMLDDYMMYSVLAKKAHWEPIRTGLQFQYDGGSAFFKTRDDATLEDIKRMANVLNSMSQAASIALESAASQKP